MMYPMLNPRKPMGRRGEGLVVAMRSKKRGMRGGAGGLLPSRLHASQTGTLAPKMFSAARKGQPVVGAPALGGLRGMQMPTS